MALLAWFKGILSKYVQQFWITGRSNLEEK